MTERDVARRTLPPDGYELEFGDDFGGPELDRSKWLPSYLPQWSSRAQAAARYLLADGHLVLQITADQDPWCPDHDGETRVSSLQTGVFAGPLGSATGQSRFEPELRVTEAQTNERLYTPQYGYFELRAKAIADPAVMVALWMIGYEDAPERSGEICICEIFGRDVGPTSAAVGMGIHPFGDPDLVDDFAKVAVDIDVTDFHIYAAEWTATHVEFFVDGQSVKLVEESPNYPMQLMLGVYEFGRAADAATVQSPYPRDFVVDYVRVYRDGREPPSRPLRRAGG